MELFAIDKNKIKESKSTLAFPQRHQRKQRLHKGTVGVVDIKYRLSNMGDLL